MADERAEAAALARLHQTGEEIIEGVARRVPSWAHDQVSRVLDAWGGLDAPVRAETQRAAAEAGQQAAARVTTELQALLEQDPADMRATPLEIVRTVTREPTVVLERLGVPPVVRDAFDEQAFPDDLYGLVPRTLGDLGDDGLAPLHLAWGMAKAAVHRARS